MSNALCNYCDADLGEENPPIGECGECIEALSDFMGRHNLSDKDMDDVPESVLKAIIKEAREVFQARLQLP